MDRCGNWNETLNSESTSKDVGFKWPFYKTCSRSLGIRLL